jgi:hypothetical protein
MTNNAICRAIQGKINELFICSQQGNYYQTRQLLRGPPHRRLLGKDSVTQAESQHPPAGTLFP